MLSYQQEMRALPYILIGLTDSGLGLGESTGRFGSVRWASLIGAFRSGDSGVRSGACRALRALTFGDGAYPRLKASPEGVG